MIQNHRARERYAQVNREIPGRESAHNWAEARPRKSAEIVGRKDSGARAILSKLEKPALSEQSESKGWGNLVYDWTSKGWALPPHSIPPAAHGPLLSKTTTPLGLATAASSFASLLKSPATAGPRQHIGMSMAGPKCPLPNPLSSKNVSGSK